MPAGDQIDCFLSCNVRINKGEFKKKKIQNTDSRPTITESMVESTNSAIESAYFMADFTADQPKVGVLLWALMFHRI